MVWSAISVDENAMVAIVFLGLVPAVRMSIEPVPLARRVNFAAPVVPKSTFFSRTHEPAFIPTCIFSDASLPNSLIWVFFLILV